MTDEKIFKKIEESVKFITGKNVVYGGAHAFEQTETTISIGSVNQNLILIHEVGHFLAATKEERKLPNLGLIENSTQDLTDWEITKELQAREMSKLIYSDWANTSFTKDSAAYVKYLTHDIFSHFEERINYKEEPIRELLIERLTELGTSLPKIHLLLNNG